MHSKTLQILNKNLSLIKESKRKEEVDPEEEGKKSNRRKKPADKKEAPKEQKAKIVGKIPNVTKGGPMPSFKPVTVTVNKKGTTVKPLGKTTKKKPAAPATPAPEKETKFNKTLKQKQLELGIPETPVDVTKKTPVEKLAKVPADKKQLKLNFDKPAAAPAAPKEEPTTAAKPQNKIPFFAGAYPGSTPPKVNIPMHRKLGGYLSKLGSAYNKFISAGEKAKAASKGDLSSIDFKGYRDKTKAIALDVNTNKVTLIGKGDNKFVRVNLFNNATNTWNFKITGKQNLGDKGTLFTLTPDNDFTRKELARNGFGYAKYLINQNYHGGVVTNYGNLMFFNNMDKYVPYKHAGEMGITFKNNAYYIGKDVKTKQPGMVTDTEKKDYNNLLAKVHNGGVASLSRKELQKYLKLHDKMQGNLNPTTEDDFVNS